MARARCAIVAAAVTAGTAVVYSGSGARKKAAALDGTRLGRQRTLAARWLLAHWSLRSVRALAYFSGGYSLALILYCMSCSCSRRCRSRQSTIRSRRSPLAEAAERASRLHSEFRTSNRKAVLLVPNWSLASRLAWYARPLPVQVGRAL